MTNEAGYLVCGARPWNKATFERIAPSLKGEWRFAADRSALEAQLSAFSPRYIFFLHWMWKVPQTVFDKHECVCFHMTDVPFGRGGSPLQNLMARGYRSTKVTALRMTADFDAGPVYMKRDLSLEGGSAEEIFLRCDEICAQMMREIAAGQPAPIPQSGDPTVFARRTPAESAIPSDFETAEQLTNFIRMLDATGYPRAFLDHGGFRFHFSRAGLYQDGVHADVRIERIPKK